MQSETIIPAGTRLLAVPDAAPASPALRVGAGLALVAALALLATVIAHWGWQLFGPAPVDVPARAPADPASALLASGLFAGPAGVPAATAPASGAAALPGDARLLGVFAEASGRGYALFRLPTGPKLVAVGSAITPGVTLAGVAPGGIRIREAAGERSIDLRTPAGRTGPAVTAAAGVRSPARAACAPPPDFKGEVVALNAELMGGLIAQPESWRALVEPGNGGLVVRDDSGFAGMMGLKRGDRIAQANGIALTVPEDILGAVLRPLAAKQTVRISGSRDGQARELWLRNVTC